MDDAKTVDLTNTHANLVKGILDQVSVDEAKRAAMLPQLHLLIEQFGEEVKIRLVSECGDKSDCELFLATVGKVVLDLVQSMLLHYNVRFLSLRLDILHSAHF